MAALDTDYVSEACTCASDDESSQDGENSDDGLGVDMTRWQEKAGLGVTAKMVVGPVWRNPDVSTHQEMISLTILTLSYQYTTFVRWLTFKYYKGKELGNRSEATRESLKKRRRTTTDTLKGYKKEFDPPPSKLLNCLPSGKRTPFKAMMAEWWLQENHDFKALDQGGGWLNGFRSHLDKTELHDLDWEHLDELVAWHENKQREAEIVEPISQVVAGPSS